MATPPVFSAGAVLTAAQMNAVGLWKIASADYTGVSSIQIDNCFTSDFTNYKLMFRISSLSTSTTRNVLARVVNGTTPETATVYSYGSNLAALGSTTIDMTVGSYSDDEFVLGQCYYSDFQFMWDVDIFEPQTTKRTSFLGGVTATSAAANASGTFYGAIANTTQYEGIQIYLTGGTGTMDCKIRIYGYRD